MKNFNQETLKYRYKLASLQRLFLVSLSSLFFFLLFSFMFYGLFFSIFLCWKRYFVQVFSPPSSTFVGVALLVIFSIFSIILFLSLLRLCLLFMLYFTWFSQGFLTVVIASATAVTVAILSCTGGLV